MDSPAVFPTNEARRPLSEAIAFVSRSPGAALILFGTLFSSTVMGSFLVWAPAFLMRQHGLDLKTAGMVTAFAGGVMPACGALVFGFAADRLGRSKAERVGLMCTIASVAMFAAGLSFALAPSTPIAFVSLILFGLFGGSWMAPSLTLLIGLTPSSIRGSVLSFGQIFTAIGAGAGPFLVGWMSDAFGSLAPALACCACVALGAVVLYLLAVRAAAETKVIRQV
jgi:MFS family permease